ncbi:UPF0160 protein C27H6.8, partial [Fragariocoptes setiger]
WRINISRFRHSRSLLLPYLGCYLLDWSLRDNKQTYIKFPQQIPEKFIGVHDGIFHCDDVLACFMLKQLPEYKDHAIVRTRNLTILAQSDIVVDVGGVFNSSIKRCGSSCRHTSHQSSGTCQTQFGRFSVRSLWYVLRTFIRNAHDRLDDQGRVYDKYRLNNALKAIEEEGAMAALAQQVYSSFIEEIDGIDNGRDMVDGHDVPYNYYINTNLNSRVARFNTKGGPVNDEMRLKNFLKPMYYVGREFTGTVMSLAMGWLPSLKRLRNVINKRFDVDPSGAIVDTAGEHLSPKSIYIVERQMGIEGQIKYVISVDRTDEYNAPWRVVAVNVSPKSFESRVPLKEEWRGLDRDKLIKKSGIPGAVFVHNSGFLGGAKTHEDVLRMARGSIAAQV